MTSEYPSLDLIYETVRERLRLQMEQIDTFDTKASISLAASGIIFGALIGFLSEAPQEWEVALAIGAMLISVAATLSVVSLWLIRVDHPPNVSRLRDTYLVSSIDDTKLAIIDVSLEAIERNQGRIRRKIFILIGAFLFLLLGILTLASYLLLLLLG